MILKRFIQHPFVLLFVLAILVSSLGLAAVAPAEAQEPGAESPQLVVLIIPPDGEASVAEIGPTPVFDVGDTFQVAVVAQGVVDPGVFGGQFEIAYQPEFLNVVEGSMVTGAALQPVIEAVNSVDNTTGLASFAASRQGDLDNLLGDVVLATLTFEAVGATEPPEGQTTTMHLQNVKLGAKGGIEVPVTGTVDLSVIIRGEPVQVDGNIVGNVKVEGRALDNQAGHEVTATGSLSGTLVTTTDSSGNFAFVDAPHDTYTMNADSPGYLSATCEGAVHASDPTALADAVLLAGDIDDSDTIDITDAVAIGAVFGSTDPQVADLNLDGVVDILDLILMAANFGRTAAENPWVCQAVSP